MRLLVEQDENHAVILLDLEGRIISWLAAAQRVFGYTENEVLNRELGVLFTPEDLEKGIPDYELEVARSNGMAENDRWMLRRDGLRFWATGVITPLRGSDGQLLGFAKVLRNRTDLKGQLEALDNQVALLKKSEERKNAFISTLAHELRNPLMSIFSAVEIMRQLAHPSDELNFASAMIQRQAEHMRRMIDDLLDITRVGAGKVELKLEPVSVGEVLRKACQTTAPHFHDRTHNFQLVLPHGPVCVNADPVRLEQVFVNLFTNAANYTQYGGNIWAKLSVDGDDAVIKVEDSGIGIPADMLPRIFDMFTQAEPAPGGADTGLGIGLSVVKQLVVMHGGTVQVKSDGLGKGSEFTVRLPLSGADQNRPHAPG